MTSYEETEELVMSVNRAYQSRDIEIKQALKLRKQMTQAMNAELKPCIDADYWCETCGSHSHKEHPVTGYCFICNTDNWKREKIADVGL